LAHAKTQKPQRKADSLAAAFADLARENEVVMLADWPKSAG